jgi:hypothetical protein
MISAGWRKISRQSRWDPGKQMYRSHSSSQFPGPKGENAPPPKKSPNEIGANSPSSSRSGSQEDGVVITDVHKAEDGVQRSLSGFLSYRFAGMKRWAEWIRGTGILGLGGSKGPPRGRGSTISSISSLPPPQAVGSGGVYRCKSLALHPDYGFTSPQRTSSVGYILVVRRRPRTLPSFCISADYHPTLTRF